MTATSVQIGRGFLDRSGSAILAPVEPRSQVHLVRAGITEQVMAIIVLLVFYHETPNSWLLSAQDRTDDYSNPLAVVVQLGLISIAFARVGGLLNQLVAVIKLEPLGFSLAGLAVLSTLWSADPAVTVRSAGVFTAVALFASYLVMRFSLQEIIRLFAFMFTASAIINLYVIERYPEIAIDRHGRFDGVFAQKNALGYVAAMALPSLLLAGRASSRLRWIFYPAFGAHSYLLLRSESKTMLVAGVGTLGLMLVYMAFRSRRTLPGAVGVGLVGSGGLALAFATANLAVLARWLDKDVTLTGRVPLWEGMIPVLKERPIVGHGFDAAFNGFFSPVHEVLIQTRWDPGDSHNALIQIWLELGVVGVLIFFVSYFRGVTRSVKIVAAVPGPVALWPLTMLSFAMFVSITETGIQSDSLGWCIYLVAVLSSAGHLRHRSEMGLSNSFRDLSVHRPVGRFC